jgi:molecular chaperone GrpE (heat shock protein)
MADKSRHGEELTNLTKVGDAMTFKGHERFSSAERLLQQAEQTADDAERLLLQGEAVDEYMEGLRQMAKEFNNFVKPYDIARYKVNGTSMIPQHMREAVEMVEDMFKAGSTVSIGQIQRAFRSMNYSFYQFADDMGACMKRITTAKSWEI